MTYSLFEILKLIGALGFFIYGMKVMSEGIQKIAGSKMRKILSLMTSNRFYGVLTGFIITSLVQSSSATTVMVVSFVNAGLLSLVESIGIIMGANIGTTITAWLISIFGFKIKIASISLPIIAIGFPMLFASNDKVKSWGEFLIGFALLFIGLNELKQAVPDIKNNSEILAFLQDYADMGILSTLFFVGVGTILTLMVQSSSAAMALTLIMCHNGWVPFELAAAMVLGENIGTTVTANLAAMVGNIHAKRTARAHFIFNFFGVVWMVTILHYFVGLIDMYMLQVHGVSPLNPDDYTSIPIALSIFHTSFNIINVILLIGFVKFIVDISIKLVPSTGDADEEFHLHHIKTSVMSTPEISILEAQKEIELFGKITSKSFSKASGLIEKQKKKKFRQAIEKVADYETLSDSLEIEIANYMAEVSKNGLSEISSQKVKSMFSTINDLESLCDICYQISRKIEKQSSQKTFFTDDQLNNLKNIFKIIQSALDRMVENLKTEYKKVSMEQADILDLEIKKMYQKLRKKHVNDLEKGRYKSESGIIYNDLLWACKKLGTHIYNVNEAIANV